MQHLFHNIERRLHTFIAQRDNVLLLVRCGETDTAFVMAMLRSIEEAGPDFHWMFTSDFLDRASYVDEVVRSFVERTAVLASMLAEAGEPAWPPLPPLLEDRCAAPVKRMQLVLMYARARIPDLDASLLVAGLLPARIADATAWRDFLRDLTAYDPPSPWCHHMRLVAREDASSDIRAVLPNTELQNIDLTLDALHRATKEAIGNSSIPLDTRMKSLLIDSNVDYAHRRFHLAIEKYTLLQTYYAATNNRTMLALALNGIGEVYAAIGREASALAYFEKAVAAAIEVACYPVALNVALNIANIHLRASRFADAAEHYEAAEELASIMLNANIKLLCLENIGTCRFAMNNYAGARQAWLDGATLAGSLDENDARRSLLTRLRDLYEQAHMRHEFNAVKAELAGLQ